MMSQRDMGCVGFSASQDISRLRTHYTTLPDPHSLYDLAHCPKARSAIMQQCPDKPNPKNFSLADLLAYTLGQDGMVMDKRPRFSDWRHRPLRKVQMDYAAADAIVLLDIYRWLN
jgi:ribonuclease D